MEPVVICGGLRGHRAQLTEVKEQAAASETRAAIADEAVRQLQRQLQEARCSSMQTLVSKRAVSFRWFQYLRTDCASY